MERYCQQQHSCPAKSTFYTFRLVSITMQVWDEPIQNQQEQDAKPETVCGRNHRTFTHIRRLFHSWNQQTPDRGRHHNPGGKAGQCPLYLRSK
nr:MAG: hypothetical protein [Bacteriophage sp.]